MALRSTTSDQPPFRASLQSPSLISRSACCLCRAMVTSSRDLHRSSMNKPAGPDRTHRASGMTFHTEMRTLRPTSGRSASTLRMLGDVNPSSSISAARTLLGATTPFGSATGFANILRLVSGTRTSSGDCQRRMLGGQITTTTPARRPPSSRRYTRCSANGLRPRGLGRRAGEPTARPSANIPIARFPTLGLMHRVFEPGPGDRQGGGLSGCRSRPGARTRRRCRRRRAGRPAR